MGFIDNITDLITSLFRKEEETLRENPDITILAIKDQKHALFVHNSDAFDVNDMYPIPRRRYKMFARDVDENMERDDQKRLLEKEHDVITRKDLVITCGKGTWSAYRTINIILPSEVAELPEPLKEVFAWYILERKAKTEILDLIRKTDMQKMIDFKSTISFYHQQMDMLMSERKAKLEDYAQKQMEVAKK